MIEIDGRLAFCCLTPTIEKTFHIMGLAQYAGIHPDEDAAVEAAQGRVTAGGGSHDRPPNPPRAGPGAAWPPGDGDGRRPAGAAAEPLVPPARRRRRGRLPRRRGGLAAAAGRPGARVRSRRHPVRALRGAERLRRLALCRWRRALAARSRRGGHGRGRGAGAGPVDLLLGVALANCRLRRRVKRQSFQASYRGVEIEALYDVGLAIASTLDLDALAEEILLRAVSLLDARRGALYLLDGRRVPARSRRFGGDARESFPDAEAERRPSGRGRSPAPSTCSPRRSRSRTTAAACWWWRTRRAAPASGRSAPRTGGPWRCSPTRPRSPWRTPDSTVRRWRRSATSATSSSPPRSSARSSPRACRDVSGYELVGWNRPAREVGGDYYDLVPCRPRRADDERPNGSGSSSADVSGKGVPAALMVSTLHSAIRLLIGRMSVGPRPGRAAEPHMLARRRTEQVHHPPDGGARLRRPASSPTSTPATTRASLIRADGRLERLDSAACRWACCPAAATGPPGSTCQPGDLLCLYSDGITECASPDDEEFGEDRLVELLRRGRRPSRSRRSSRRSTARSPTFAAGQPQGDDQTVVLLRRKP